MKNKKLTTQELLKLLQNKNSYIILKKVCNNISYLEIYDDFGNIAASTGYLSSSEIKYFNKLIKTKIKLISARYILLPPKFEMEVL